MPVPGNLGGSWDEQETLRSFWEQQLQQDPAYVRNVQLSCPWLTYCSWVLLPVIPLLFIYAYGARVSLFLGALWLRLCVFIAHFYLLMLPRVQKWFHQQRVKKQLANVPPQLSVVLFHNNKAEGKVISNAMTWSFMSKTCELFLWDSFDFSMRPQRFEMMWVWVCVCERRKKISLQLQLCECIGASCLSSACLCVDTVCTAIKYG